MLTFIDLVAGAAAQCGLLADGSNGQHVVVHLPTAACERAPHQRAASKPLFGRYVSLCPDRTDDGGRWRTDSCLRPWRSKSTAGRRLPRRCEPNHVAMFLAFQHDAKPVIPGVCLVAQDGDRLVEMANDEIWTAVIVQVADGDAAAGRR
jgi:hypothetical protein